MNILKLICELDELYDKHGNLQVGFMSEEYDCFYEIRNINYRKSSGQRNRLSDDDESLGAYFIGIE